MRDRIVLQTEFSKMPCRLGAPVLMKKRFASASVKIKIGVLAYDAKKKLRTVFPSAQFI